jgi:hypothetical protein
MMKEVKNIHNLDGVTYIEKYAWQCRNNNYYKMKTGGKRKHIFWKLTLQIFERKVSN